MDVNAVLPYVMGVLFLGGSVCILVWMRHAVRRGAIRMEHARLCREEKPGRFWAQVVAWYVVAALLAGGAIMGLIAS